MIELSNVTKSIVDNCASLMLEILPRSVEKYHGSLKPGGSGNMLVDGCKMVIFHAKERGKLVKLQETLKTSTGRISVLVAAAAQ